MNALQDTENTHLMVIAHLHNKIQQLENQMALVKKENGRLNFEKKHCITTIANQKLDIEALEATKDQLEEDRYRLEVQQKQNDKQLTQVSNLLY